MIFLVAFLVICYYSIHMNIKFKDIQDATVKAALNTFIQFEADRPVYTLDQFRKRYKSRLIHHNDDDVGLRTIIAWMEMTGVTAVEGTVSG